MRADSSSTSRSDEQVLRRVVRAVLAHDADAVDDVVQETMIASLRRPRDVADPTAWLARVGRRLAISRLRQSTRRARREQHAARPEAEAATIDVVADRGLAREVADAVQGLPAIYRDAIRKRFWDDLPPRRIAALEGVSVRTIDSRIYRGLAMLREALHADDRDRRERLLVFAAGPRRSAVAWVAAGIAATLLLGITTAVLVFSSAEVGPTDTTEQASAPDAAAPPGPALAATDASESRSPDPRLVPAAPSSAPEPADGTWPRRVAVRCFDVDDPTRAIAGVTVAVRGCTWQNSPKLSAAARARGEPEFQDVTATCGADGLARVEIEHDADAWFVTVSSPDHVATTTPGWSTELRTDYDVPLRSRPRLRVVAHSTDGAPLAGAKLTVATFGPLVVRHPSGARSTAIERHEVGVTDAAGYFEAAWSFPPPGLLVVTAPGHLPHHVPLATCVGRPEGATLRVDLVRPQPRTIEVVSRRGRPLPKLDVVVSARRPADAPPHPLLAWGPSTLRDVPGTFQTMGQCAWLGYEMTEARTDAEGRVTFANCSPATDARVALLDPVGGRIDLVAVDGGEVIHTHPAYGSFDIDERTTIRVVVDVVELPPLQVSGWFEGAVEPADVAATEFRLMGSNDVAYYRGSLQTEYLLEASQPVEATVDGLAFGVEQPGRDVGELMLAYRIPGGDWRFAGPFDGTGHYADVRLAAR